MYVFYIFELQPAKVFVAVPHQYLLVNLKLMASNGKFRWQFSGMYITPNQRQVMLSAVYQSVHVYIAMYYRDSFIFISIFPVI